MAVIETARTQSKPNGPYLYFSEDAGLCQGTTTVARFIGLGRDTGPAYEAAEAFRERFLRADGSLLFDDAQVWTLASLDRLRENYVNAPAD